MSEPEEPGPTAGRPRQVTMGAWVAGGCSIAMLFVVGTVVTRLKTVDFREGVSSFLDDQRAAGVSMSLDTALTVIRVGLMVCGAVAAAIGVFAFFAARRDRSARVAMSVLAAPMLVTGVFVDPFLAGFVVAATVLLWTAPAREWYAGRTPAPAGASGPSLAAGSPPPATLSAPVGERSPYAPTAPPARSSPPTTRSRRPTRVLVACLLAAAMSALTAGAMVLTAVVLQSASARSDIERVIRDNPSFSDSGLGVGDLARASTVVAVLVALWAVAALVLAGFALVGHQWARVALLISAGVAGLVALGSSLVFPGFLVVTAACVLTGVLLINPDVNAWYAARPRAPKPPPPASPW